MAGMEGRTGWLSPPGIAPVMSEKYTRPIGVRGIAAVTTSPQLYGYSRSAALLSIDQGKDKLVNVAAIAECGPVEIPALLPLRARQFSQARG